MAGLLVTSSSVRLVPNTTGNSPRIDLARAWMYSDRLTGQSWCGALRASRDPGGRKKGLDDARPGSRCLGCHGPANHSRASVGFTGQHTRPPAIQACSAEMPTAASWSRRRHPIHPTIPCPFHGIEGIHRPSSALGLLVFFFSRPRREPSIWFFFLHDGPGQDRELRQP